MAAPKLIQILSSISKDEWPSLKKNILLHTSESSDLFKIFKYLMDRKEKLADIDDVEPIVQKHFPKLGSKVFLNHLSTLYQYTESWLVNEQLAIEPHTYQLILHRAFNKRGLYHQANQIAEKTQKTYQGKQSLMDLQTLASIHHQSHYSYNPIKYEKGVLSFSDVVQSHQQNFYHSLAIYQLELDSWGKIQNHSYEDEKERIRNILALISLHKYNDFLVLLHEALQSDNVALLIQLIDRLLAFEWPHRSFEEVISTLYLIRKLSELHQRGFDIDAKTILSKLYDFAMKQGVFSEHGKLSHMTFSNIVSYHCTFQSYEFTQSFIHKWYKDVATSHPTTTRDISLALASFKFGKYKELIELTRMKNFADHQEKAMALLLHLIGTFMNRNQDYEMFENDLRNFNSYMIRNKKEFSTKIFKGKMNLVDVLKRIDKKSKNIDLKSYDFLFFRDWCAKIIEEK